MELEHKPTHQIDVQASSMLQIQTEVCNTVELTNIKLESESYTHGDRATCSENTIYSDHAGIRVEIKTEVNETDEDGNRNIARTSTHCNDDRYFNDACISREWTYDIGVPVVKAEPDDGCLETTDSTGFIIEIDTCKDEPHEYRHNCVNDDIKPCVIVLSDIKHTYPNILKHHSVKMSDIELSCAVYEQCAASFTNIDRYMENNNIYKLHECPMCAATFSCKGKLNRHIRIHTGVKPYKCSVCGYASTRKDVLDTHTRIHTGEKPHRCTVCEISFTNSGNLAKHIQIHTGEKPHKCSVCGVGFAHPSSLRSHRKTHTGEKSNICSVCGIGFTRKRSLMIHMRKHTGEKPHKCTLCGVSFTRKDALAYHMRTHTGEKPYTCSVCGVAFAHKCSLMSHIRGHAGRSGTHVPCVE